MVELHGHIRNFTALASKSDIFLKQLQQTTYFYGRQPAISPSEWGLKNENRNVHEALAKYALPNTSIL